MELFSNFIMLYRFHLLGDESQGSRLTCSILSLLYKKMIFTSVSIFEFSNIVAKHYNSY